jgi:holo-[acyl-carrier protein] synthase
MLIRRGNRWAVKEALYKAAYPDFRLTWKQITLTKDLNKPVLKITYPPPTDADVKDPKTRNAPRIDGVHERCHVSVSHDADLVVAYVVVESLP